MRYFLAIGAVALILIGFFYELAYYKRKRLTFDEKCNNFYIVSRAFSIMGIVLLVLSSVLIVFNW